MTEHRKAWYRKYLKQPKWRRYKTLYNRAWRKKNGTYKDSVRRKLLAIVNKGLIKRKPCEVCGSRKNIEMHHDDYRKPLNIMFLCRIHHRERDILVGTRTK